MELVKGSSVKIVNTVYSNWTGDATTSLIANLTGATINMYVKKRDGDSDANALLTKSGNVTDAVNGVCEVVVAAGDTNNLSYMNLVYEIVVKLSDGTYVRSGVNLFTLLPNVGKTLF